MYSKGAALQNDEKKLTSRGRSLFQIVQFATRTRGVETVRMMRVSVDDDAFQHGYLHDALRESHGSE